MGSDASPDELYREILARPDDDELRLSYAAALDARGDPRGEFVRVQRELERLPEFDDRRAALRKREAELADRHGLTWAGAPDRGIRNTGEGEDPSSTAQRRFGPLVAKGDVWQFGRGTLAMAEMMLPEFLRNAEQIFRLAPLRSIALNGLYRWDELGMGEKYEVLRKSYDGIWGSEDSVGPLAACTHLMRLRDLRLNCGMAGDPAVQEFVRSPNLASLRSMTLYLRKQTALSAHAVAASPHLGRLRRLEFRYDDEISWSGNFGDAGAAAMANSPHLTRLEALVLERGRIGPEGVKALVNSPYLAHLQHLDVGGNPVGLAGVQAVAASPRALRLRSLGLSGATAADSVDQPIGLAGAEALATSPHLSGLTRLDLSQNELDAQAVAALARARWAAGLTSLDLGGNAIGDAGVAALAASPQLAKLKELDLSFTEISDESFRALAASPHLTQLRLLRLSCNEFTRAGLEALVSSANVAYLTVLDLSGFVSDRKLDEPEMRAIAGSPHLSRLNELRINYFTTDEAGARALASSPYLDNLIRLSGLSARTPPGAAEILRERWGDRAVDWKPKEESGSAAEMDPRGHSRR
jgi:uncharacterized protein (TIGR02996 family)